MADHSEGCKLDLHLSAADTRSAVAVARFQFVDRRNIRAQLGCCRSRSGSEVESTPEVLRLVVLERCTGDCCFRRSKVERQRTVQVRGQQVFYPQPIRYPDMASYRNGDVYEQ